MSFSNGPVPQVPMPASSRRAPSNPPSSSHRPPRAPDLPGGTTAGAVRQVWVDGEPACDFSGGAGLHPVMYREVTAGRGHLIGDAKDGIRLAEQVRRAASESAPGAPPPRQATSGQLASR
jgi:hypothetical protein